MKQIDINSQSQYPADVLSNLYPKPFFMNGKFCGSIEGFLQGCRVKCPIEQEKVYGMSGIKAKSQGYKHPIKNDTLYHLGKPFNRHSAYYQSLLLGAYQKCFAQNEKFQKALYDTLDCELIHSIGKNDPNETILTNKEFISILRVLQKTHKIFLIDKFGTLSN